MDTSFEKAKKYIRDTHANTGISLLAVKDQLEELRDLAEDLIHAIDYDILMQETDE